MIYTFVVAEKAKFPKEFEQESFVSNLLHRPTIIARFGSDGPDYMSGLEFASEEASPGMKKYKAEFGCNHPLCEAFIRAQVGGLF